jgi:2-(1,2-epoxy-1,2-dihydrophenyl)acetyl-CoA isomerase
MIEVENMVDDNNPIIFEEQGAIARIRFNRPAALNALDSASARGLLQASRAIARSRQVRVVVISGVGRAFVAGGDLAAFHADLAHAAQSASEIIEPLHEALDILAGLPQLVLASVHGAVAGAGVGVMLACDLAIAADNTRVNLAYARIGASPDAGASWCLPHLVGIRKAMELVIMAETIDAGEALRLGLVNRVVPASELAGATDALAARLAEGPSHAYGHSKRLIRTAHGRQYAEQLEAEHEAFRSCANRQEFGEGVNAFFEKRPARFQNP